MKEDLQTALHGEHGAVHAADIITGQSSAVQHRKRTDSQINNVKTSPRPADVEMVSELVVSNDSASIRLEYTKGIQSPTAISVETNQTAVTTKVMAVHLFLRSATVNSELHRRSNSAYKVR
jgi:hypothetical protein